MRKLPHCPNCGSNHVEQKWGTCRTINGIRVAKAQYWCHECASFSTMRFVLCGSILVTQEPTYQKPNVLSRKERNHHAVEPDRSHATRIAAAGTQKNLEAVAVS